MLPVVAEFPSREVRQALTETQWNDYQDLLAIVIQSYVDAGDKLHKLVQEPALEVFLVSFYHTIANDHHDTELSSTRFVSLRKQVGLLLKTCFDQHICVDRLSELNFLVDFARCQPRSQQTSNLLSQAWTVKGQHFQKSMQIWKKSATEQLESKTPETAQKQLMALLPLLAASSEAASYILTGSDFLDAATSAYAKTADEQLRKTIAVATFLGLKSLISGRHSNTAAVTDHLYDLRSKQRNDDPSLLVDLVTNTSLLNRIRQQNMDSPSERITKLVESLETYRHPTQARRRARPVNKGKARQKPSEDLHIHKMSLISQVQDLFPDLGAGFVMRLLDVYDDNTEEIISHLLEDSLPQHFRDLDRHESAPIFSTDTHEVIDHLAPRSTPPLEQFVPQRVNAFDDDELDRLSVDTSRLHIGKREDTTSSAQPNKAAILAALAVFDADDDERDDTYDAEDVGGTIDTAHHDGDEATLVDENDIKLYKLFEASPDVFGRSSETRRSKERASLREQTGLTDEAIETWAIVLQRDPKKSRKLAYEASRFDGRQNEIARTAYRAANDGSDAEHADGVPNRGGSRGRGRGSYRGGRGRGNVAGPSNDADNAAAKKRKEANKSSRANHNRRDQRARKMARGGFPNAA